MSAQGPGSSTSSIAQRVHGVLVTYRRPEQLARTLDALSRQTRRLDSLVVVDNDPSASAAGACEQAAAIHLPTYSNLGPAGGLAAGLAHIRILASPQDWVVFLDDDDPPPTHDTIDRLCTYLAETTPAEQVAGTGLVGARYDRRTGRSRRVPDEDLRGVVSVDWIGGGQCPVYRLDALTAVDAPDASLFFGFDDLDVGLRLREAGWTLHIDAAQWIANRSSHGRLGLADSTIRRGQGPTPPWRDYYSSRNLLLLAASHGSWTAVAATTARSVGRAVRLGLRRSTWARSRRAWRGIWDGLRGVRGRQIDP